MDRYILLVHDNATAFEEDEKFSSKLKEATYKFSFENGALFSLDFHKQDDF